MSHTLSSVVQLHPCSTKQIYLDYQATTPCDARVVHAMLPYLTEYFGNPHSRNHAYGWQGEEAVEQARHILAQAIGAKDKDIIFTAGATEANNIAIKGLAYAYANGTAKKKPTTEVVQSRGSQVPGGKGHIITLNIEHKCVMETVRALEQEGFQATYVPVEPSGLVCLETLAKAFRPDTFLLSVGAANGEIGVLQPLKEIGALCAAHGVYFHTDAAQAFGKIPLDVETMGIDLLSLSSHKIYGPKGIGALYVRRKPRVRLRPLMHGGGQERGLRPGTLAPFLCVGFATACTLAMESMEEENQRILALRQEMWEILHQALPEIYLNGHAHHRLPGNLNISFFGVEGEGLMMAAKELALSSGSACTSASLEPSYVLRAIGVGDAMAHTSLRIGLGRFTTREEVQKGAQVIIQAVERLRSLSPLWDMHQQGIDIESIAWVAH